MVRNGLVGMSRSGGALFGGKKPPEATLPGSTRVFVQQNLEGPSKMAYGLAPGPSKKRVLGLIRTLTAPNGVNMSGSGAESPGGADYGGWFGPRGVKMARKN